MKAAVTCLALGLWVASSMASESNSPQNPPTEIKLESSFSESLSRDGVVQTVVNTTFVPTSLYSPQKKDHISALLTQRFENTSLSGRERGRSKLEVIAWISGKRKYDTKLWTINDCAETGTLLHDFYQTTEYGCCGAESLHHAYSLKTGKYRFSYTADPVSVDISFLGNPHDNGLRRRITYISGGTQESACHNVALPKTAIGILTLSDAVSDDSTQLDRIVLESDDRELAWSPKVSVLSKENPNGADHTLVMYKDYINPAVAVKGFSVKAFYFRGMEVIVPIVNDKFDIKGAILPAPIKLRRVAIEQHN
jgi:hypothetical protein